jgi:diaminopimelate epimerase
MPGAYINVGNPHLLFSGYKSGYKTKQDFISWVKNKIDQDDRYSNFNISQYIKLDDNLDERLDSRLYSLCTVERGVGPTPSCSSAALALCNLLKYKYNLLNIKNLTIQMPGGDLDVKFSQIKHIKSDGAGGNHDIVSFSAPVSKIL